MFEVKGKSFSDATTKPVYKIRDGLDGNVEFLFYNAPRWEWEAADDYEPVAHKLTYDKWPR